MQKINQSRKLMCAAAVVMFLIMLVGNVLTDYCTDDFHYMHSFTDQATRITSVAQIIPSMAVHASSMNGRLIAHGLVQLFLMLPPIIFDVVNSAMFVLQTYLIYRLANRSRKTNLLMFCLIYACIWLFEMAFGQVNFWLTGSCNYLWNAVVAMAFMIPYVDKVFDNRNLKGTGAVAYLVFSFIAGAYSESVSAAMIFTSFFLACYAQFVLHHRLKFYHYAALAIAFIGFLSMIFVPSSSTRGNEFTAWNMLKSVGRAGNMFYKMWPVVLGFVVLFIVGCYRKLDKKILVSTFILAAGAVFAECIMLFADYNVERRAFFTLLLLVAASAMLFNELIYMPRYTLRLLCIGACLLLAGFYYTSLGLCDIAITHGDIVENRAYIAECKARGEMEITLPEVTTRTKYSALNGLQYLREGDSNYWLNRLMASYYGVERIHLDPAED